MQFFLKAQALISFQQQVNKLFNCHFIYIVANLTVMGYPLAHYDTKITKGGITVKNQNRDTGLVYSDEFGRMCPDCHKSVAKCICRKKPAPPASDGIVRLMRETKGRKGKGVTLITGLPLNSEELKKLAKSLKQKCGSGGSIKNRTIEIQGDHRDALEKELHGLGYRVKRAGG